ncbi:MAG: serine/threonine-protein kinase [Myxococcota bacterium]
MSNPSPPPMPPQGDGPLLTIGECVDRYEVIEPVGSGGTAMVYKVRHRDLNTTYALKVLTLLSPSIRDRTLQEARLQATLQHENVVAVYDVLDVKGAPGLLMEYVEGPSLETALENYQFPLEHAETVFKGLLAGVGRAHRLGFVHRDLKPANILLAKTPLGIVPKVTDFGIAKVVEGDVARSGKTRAGIAMGTPQYMAPEQIRDARGVDQRADIFSLGAVLYELVSGHRAFPQDDILEIYNAVAKGTYQPITDHKPEVPEGVQHAIEGALRVDVSARIPDCETMLEVFLGRRTFGVADLPTEVIEFEDLVDGPEEPKYILPRSLLPSFKAAVVPSETPSEPTPQRDAPPVDDSTRRMLAVALVFVAFAVLSFWLGTRVSPPSPEAQAPAATETSAPLPALKITEPPAPPAPTAVEPPAAAPKPAPAPPREPSVQPKVEPTPPKPVAAPVQVKLGSQPMVASITVDGRQLGKTPTRISLTPGRHRVTLAEGGRTGTVTIDVAAEGSNQWCYLFETQAMVEGRCPR